MGECFVWGKQHVSTIRFVVHIVRIRGERKIDQTKSNQTGDFGLTFRGKRFCLIFSQTEKIGPVRFVTAQSRINQTGASVLLHDDKIVWVIVTMQQQIDGGNRVVFPV